MLSNHSIARVVTVICGLGLGTVSAVGAELTAQNDSGTVGSSLPNFIPGDIATAWLTSPCDGSVVAVQVMWQSQVVGGAPQTTEMAIRVYGSGTFPAPGAVLTNAVGGGPAEILGPLMTDSASINEFRYLDAGLTTPLSVPVTNGQTVVVGLEFLNQNSGNPFAASVVQDNDGCQVGSSSIFSIDSPPDYWFGAVPLGFTGDLMIRAVVDCAAEDAPATSEWGLVATTFLVLIIGTLLFSRGKRSTQSRMA